MILHLQQWQPRPVVQKGTHQSLAGVDGMYKRLWQVQNQLADDLRQELASDDHGPGEEGDNGS